MEPQLLPPEPHAEVAYHTDSAYSSCESDTGTLSAETTDFCYENGRRYHASSQESYWGANDDEAQDIQDLTHHLYSITFGEKLLHAPVHEPQSILDIGTGTGLWAIDMADEFPAAKVIGTDLSPIQPSFVPPNCEFQIDDATTEWTFPLDQFDLVHAYRHIKPGGWIEIVERSVVPISDDNTVGSDHFFTSWGETILECGRRSGKTFEIWKHSKRYLENAGFVNVQQTTFLWPMNGWPTDQKLKEIGRWNHLRLHHGVEGLMLRPLTKVLGWSYERAELFLAEMRRNLGDFKTHAYLPGTVVWAQKPKQF